MDTHVTPPKAQQSNHGLRLVYILWLAVVVFGLPEVFAGTGRLWLVRPDVYILGLPLYTLHFLLLVHIAVRSRRTSWPALYLFGVLFALYETWITKVVWNGYPGADGFAFGGFGAWFGVHETLGLVLFYHPVTSFLLPLAVISRLFPVFGKPFPTPDWVFGTTKGGMIRRFVLLLVWGIVTGYNLEQPIVFLLTWIPMLTIIWAGYIYLEKKGVTASTGYLAETVARPVLGRRGLILVLVWLVLMYFVTYALLIPENLPPQHIQLITLGFYPVLVFPILRTPKIFHNTQQQLPHPARMPALWLLSIFLLGLFVTFFVPPGQVRTALAIIPFLGMMLLGAALFLWLVVWRVIVKPGAVETG
jgi:hypothetical protein